jgi:hypothetical protein
MTKQLHNRKSWRREMKRCTKIILSISNIVFAVFTLQLFFSDTTLYASDYSSHLKKNQAQLNSDIDEKIRTVDNKIKELETKNDKLLEKLPEISKRKKQWEEVLSDDKTREIVKKYSAINKDKLNSIIDNGIVKNWCLQGKQIQSALMNEWCVLHSQSVVQMARSFYNDKTVSKKCSSIDECIEPSFKRIESLPQNKLSAQEKETIKKLFLDYNENIDTHYTNLKFAEDYIDHKSLLEKGETSLLEKSESVKTELKPLREEREKLIYQKEVINGIREPKDLKDYSLIFKASTDATYTSQPPFDGPSDKNQYFVWSGNPTKKDGSLYIIWEVFLNNKRGFAFKNIEKRFCEIQQNKRIYVLGRYSSNTEIQLVSGQTVTIPVLESCIISDNF